MGGMQMKWNRSFLIFILTFSFVFVVPEKRADAFIFRAAAGLIGAAAGITAAAFVGTARLAARVVTFPFRLVFGRPYYWPYYGYRRGYYYPSRYYNNYYNNYYGSAGGYGDPSAYVGGCVKDCGGGSWDSSSAHGNGWSSDGHSADYSNSSTSWCDNKYRPDWSENGNWPAYCWANWKGQRFESRLNSSPESRADIRRQVCQQARWNGGDAANAVAALDIKCQRTR